MVGVAPPSSIIRTLPVSNIHCNLVSLWWGSLFDVFFFLSGKFCKHSVEVMGPNYMDEIDCGNFFDQIDDLIDFPPDDDECGDGNLVSSSDCKNYPSWDDALQECDPLFSGSHVDIASDLSAELSVPVSTAPSA